MSASADSLPLPVPDLAGKVYLVTGGNAGIGLETAFQLAHQHAKVYIGCRSESKGRAAISTIQSRVTGADVHLLIMDLVDLASVVNAAKQFLKNESHLHGLINNAGIMATPLAITKDGYEAQLQTNYLSHWLLTYYLTPLLLDTSKSTPQGSVRVVNVTSMGHSFAPKGGIAFDDMNQVGRKAGPWTRYGMSKLANILHARELHRRYGPASDSSEKIWTAATHPGNVDTGLSRNSAFIGWLSPFTAPLLKYLGVLITAPEAAATPVFAATDPDVESGSYLVPIAKMGKESKEAKDTELEKELWAWTEREMRSKGFIS